MRFLRLSLAFRTYSQLIHSVSDCCRAIAVPNTVVPAELVNSIPSKTETVFWECVLPAFSTFSMRELTSKTQLRPHRLATLYGQDRTALTAGGQGAVDGERRMDLVEVSSTLSLARRVES